MVKAADQFHAGVVVDDLDAAMTWLADACGYRWCQEVRLEILFVTPRAETNLSLRVTYSMDEPHLELVEAVPGTLFTPSTTNLHHLGFWSDDIDGDVAALEAVGGSLEGKGYPRTGDEPSWAFVKAPDGPLIELVASTAKPWMDRWWATGLPR